MTCVNNNVSLKLLDSTVIRMYMISNNTQVGPKCAIIYLPHHKPEPSIQVRHAFMSITPNSEHATLFLSFKCPCLVSLCQSCVLLIADRSGTRFGLLPEPICFMFQRVLRPEKLLCISQF